MTPQRILQLWCARAWPNTLVEALIVLASAVTTGMLVCAILVWLFNPH